MSPWLGTNRFQGSEPHARPQNISPANPALSPISQASNGLKLVSAPAPTDEALPLSTPTSQFPMGKAWPQWLCVHVQGSWTFRAGGRCLGSLGRRQESAGDKTDLTQFVTSNVKRVINPSEMGIHHRDQPELGFGKGPTFGFSQLNPSGPTLGTISASQSLLLPGTKPVGHQLQDVPCLKTRHKGEEIIPSPSELPKYLREHRVSLCNGPSLGSSIPAKQNRKKPAQKMLRPNPGTQRHQGGSRWNQ